MDDLRKQVHAIECLSEKIEEKLSFEISAIDQGLKKGGLCSGALHEFSGASHSIGDDAAATLFIAGICARAAAGRGMVLWAFRQHDLFAPALAQVGLTPHRLVQVECGRDEHVLTAMEEGLRHRNLVAVVGETSQVSMTATRRLQLAAEESGTMALLLRKWRKAGVDPLSHASAAVTRWKIGCLPSGSLPVQGVGRPRWRVELVRQRGGEAHQWILEGCDAEGRLALPAGPSHRSAAADRDEARRAA